MIVNEPESSAVASSAGAWLPASAQRTIVTASPGSQLEPVRTMVSPGAYATLSAVMRGGVSVPWARAFGTSAARNSRTRPANPAAASAARKAFGEKRDFLVVSIGLLLVVVD